LQSARQMPRCNREGRGARSVGAKGTPDSISFDQVRPTGIADKSHYLSDAIPPAEAGRGQRCPFGRLFLHADPHSQRLRQPLPHPPWLSRLDPPGRICNPHSRSSSCDWECLNEVVDFAVDNLFTWGFCTSLRTFLTSVCDCEVIVDLAVPGHLEDDLWISRILNGLNCNLQEFGSF